MFYFFFYDVIKVELQQFEIYDLTNVAYLLFFHVLNVGQTVSIRVSSKNNLCYYLRITKNYFKLKKQQYS